MCELGEIRDCPLDEQLELHCVQTTLARKKMQLELRLRPQSQAPADIRLDQANLLARGAVQMKHTLTADAGLR